jgi:hypothetical protein
MGEFTNGDFHVYLIERMNHEIQVTMSTIVKKKKVLLKKSGKRTSNTNKGFEKA